MTGRMRVGVGGALRSATTPHGATLLRAVATAINTIPGFAAMELVFGDDEASGARAIEVAHRFVASGVDLVLGPFGSDCLMATADIYLEARIPAVTPAATVRMEQPCPMIFRICSNDDSIAAVLVERLQSRGFRQVAVLSDDSNHCRRLKQVVDGLLAQHGFRSDADTDGAEALVFTGRLRASHAWLAQLRQKRPTIPVLMTDDAAASNLVEGIAEPGDLEVLGFPASHQARIARSEVNHYWSVYGAPPIYALETLAAAAVLAQAAATGEPLEALRRDTFSTALGSVRFADGERCEAMLAWWRPTRDGVLAATDLVATPPRHSVHH